MAEDAPRLRQTYEDEVRPKLVEQFGYENSMEVPRLKKITVNKGVGEASENEKALDTAVEELRKITGQHPTVNRAKKSIASFNIREGMPVGVTVTLREARMYEFLTVSLPLHCPISGTLKAFPIGASMVTETIRSGSRSK